MEYRIVFMEMTNCRECVEVHRYAHLEHSSAPQRIASSLLMSVMEWTTVRWDLMNITALSLHVLRSRLIVLMERALMLISLVILSGIVEMDQMNFLLYAVQILPVLTTSSTVPTPRPVSAWTFSVKEQHIVPQALSLEMTAMLTYVRGIILAEGLAHVCH